MIAVYLVLGYNDTKANARAAAKVVFGAIKAKGVLPATAGPFPVGLTVCTF